MAGSVGEAGFEAIRQLNGVANEIHRGDRMVWLAVQVSDPVQTQRFLVERLNLSPLAVEDALSDNERPALYEHPGSLFLEVSVPSEKPNTEIAIFVGQTFVVTVTTQESKLIQEWFSRWSQHPLDFGRSPTWLLHSLLDAVVDSYFPICDKLEDDVDALEEVVFHGDGELVESALGLKRQILGLRRQVTPIRDVVNGLLRKDAGVVPNEVRPYLQDVYDHTLRLSEILDVNREILGGIVDAHLAMVSNNLNNTMRVLTVGATFLMTAGLVTGIYGMNFKWMPETQWPWGYPLAMLSIVGLVAGEYVLFKRKGWF